MQQSEVSDDTAFSRRLSEAMKRRSFSAERLSEGTSGAIAPRTVYRWLSGESEPGIGAVRLLCPVLKVNADWLLGLSDKQ